MDYLLALVAFGALAGVIALWVVSERRYKRTKRRLNEALHRALVAVPESLIPLRGLYAERFASPAPRLPLTFRSEFGEDMALVCLFEGARTGYFVEVGANDGLRYSATYALEALGWNGLLIEPIPALAELCRQRRPHARVVNAALGKRGSTGNARFVTYEKAGEHSDLASHLASVDQSFRKPAGRHAREIEVPLTTMDALLADAPRVDVAIIDVEGGELDLLDGFEIERLRPRVLIVEDHDLAVSDAQRRAIEPRGYTQAGTLGFNRIFIHNDETALAERAQTLLCLDQVEAI